MLSANSQIIHVWWIAEIHERHSPSIAHTVYETWPAGRRHCRWPQRVDRWDKRQTKCVVRGDHPLLHKRNSLPPPETSPPSDASRCQDCVHACEETSTRRCWHSYWSGRQNGLERTRREVDLGFLLSPPPSPLLYQPAASHQQLDHKLSSHLQTSRVLQILRDCFWIAFYWWLLCGLLRPILMLFISKEPISLRIVFFSLW